MNNLSLSARRAWIEIRTPSLAALAAAVALRKESVDRNVSTANDGTTVTVALRKESVDRNKFLFYIVYRAHGRSPQGERG